MLRDARAIGAARGLSFLWLRNVSRTGLTTWLGLGLGLGLGLTLTLTLTLTR